MPDDGWEPLGYVGEDAIVPSQLDDTPYDLPLDVCPETLTLEVGPQVGDMLAGDKTLHFDRLVVVRRIKLSKSAKLLIDAAEGDDKRWRNYMKALKRSKRNSRAGG